MRRFIRLVSPYVFVFPLLTVAAACDDKPTTPSAPVPSATTAPITAMPTATAETPPMATAAPTPAPVEPPRESRMANCPSAVPGAIVAMKDVEGGVEVSITGKDDASAKEIKTRMAKLVEADKNQNASGKHDHAGSGGGRGHCTIVIMRKTKIETADLPNGIKATVKATEKSEVEWLRKETRERDKEAKMGGIENAGTKHMAHCPSAVPGAKTAVKDAKEGVVVTVTGSGEAVKDIRDRAKHTAAVAKMADPPKVEHNSEGKGGGGLGKCPVIVEGDTTVEVKDVENGSEITVKAKKDVATLQKEAKLRAASFGAK